MNIKQAIPADFQSERTCFSLFIGIILLLGVNANAGQSEITVGERKISVPYPEGYVELTPAMSPHYEMMRSYIAPTNISYFTLIQEETASGILKGQERQFIRYMKLETEKGLAAASVSKSQFREFRHVVRNQIDETYEKLEDTLPAMMDDGNKAASEALGSDMVADVGGIVPLPIHVDNESAIGHSMYATVSFDVDGEDVGGGGVIALTGLFIHVKDKVLFLYVYGAQDDLEWTRATVESWGESILDANPLSLEEEKAVERSSNRGINWNPVLENMISGALVGAVIAGLIGLFSAFFRKGKKEQ